MADLGRGGHVYEVLLRHLSTHSLNVEIYALSSSIVLLKYFSHPHSVTQRILIWKSCFWSKFPTKIKKCSRCHEGHLEAPQVQKFIGFEPSDGETIDGEFRRNCAQGRFLVDKIKLFCIQNNQFQSNSYDYWQFSSKPNLFKVVLGS